MTSSQVQGLIRWAITSIAGFGAATSWFDGAPILSAAGALVMFGTMMWGMFHHKAA